MGGFVFEKKRMPGNLPVFSSIFNMLPFLLNRQSNMPPLVRVKAEREMLNLAYLIAGVIKTGGRPIAWPSPWPYRNI
jgi:hypothetical protein